MNAHTTWDLADLALMDTIAQALTPRATAQAIQLYTDVQAMAPRRRVSVEPGSYAMTGSGFLAWMGLQQDFSMDDVQALDAPMHIARGSVQCGFESSDGVVSVWTSELMVGRVRS